MALVSTTASADKKGHDDEDCHRDHRYGKDDNRSGVDFVVSKDVLSSSATTHWMFFTPWSEDYRRGCVFRMGFRRVLRFNTEIINQGERDFEWGAPPTPEWVKYSFLRLDNTEAIPSRYQSIPMKDDRQVHGDRPGKFSYHIQGLSSGWATLQPAKAHCQLFDITELKAGSYIIEVEVNPDHAFEESDYCNNKARFPVDLR